MTTHAVTPSTLEVDYDTNLTELYRAITDQDWERAVSYCQKYPQQAATWVVRHYQTDQDGGGEKEIMWRFLPLHSACARQPPAPVVSALLKAYPDAAKCVDDQGMYALHYACGNQAGRDVIRLLLVAFPDASKQPDPRGMLPIHYAACWGPSSVSVMDMLLVAHRDIALAKDADGNTAMDLALEGDYPEKPAVVAALQKWLKSNQGSGASVASGSKKKTGLRNISTTEEEKKEEEEVSSPRTLQRKVDRLLNDIHAKEVGWSEQNAHLANGWKNKVLELEEKSMDKEKDLRDLKIELEVAKKEAHNAKQELKQKEAELEETKHQLLQSNEERKGLQMTLGDLMEQQLTFKKQTGNMKDRLGSLSASLESMMDQQNTVVKAMTERNARYKDTLQKRKAKFDELMQLESEIEADGINLDFSLRKQTMEMEAIAAVIAAARGD